MRVELFDFTLPQERIATEPASPRDAARLLHVHATGLGDLGVRDLPSLLRPGDVMVFNDTKVIPARLYGMRGEVRVEILLHKELDATRWQVFAKPAKRLRVGDGVIFAPGFSASVEAKSDDGQVTLRFHAADHDGFYRLLFDYGDIPLPPYIAREGQSRAEDRENYQTVYAKHEGSVAAPTAGLHFTDALLEAIRARGVALEYVTLHVGGGTFLPVKAEDTTEHIMHSEWGRLTAETAERINAARAAGGRVIAVGTTSMRLLETVVDESGCLQSYLGDTAIFITPGYRFKIVDCLMTNFHLPKSTLFMLVSAFSGLQRMKAAYTHAIANEYRFYSYGDSSFLERCAEDIA
jgi:S-adenosylmethionine:tRNA ribosyltransferase-isomerase